ncbi:MAG TPA: hypothetical protein VKA76_07265 [Gammaproteobacteria bacterium]|nr:hypothetical protein [Gammaproteobacteria bacterium]
MSARVDYYSLRRVNPYLGVIQVVDAGGVRAYSTDGRAWQARRVYDSERFWSESQGTAPSWDDLGRGELQRALSDRPVMPFALGDRYELWLLERASGLPLALLKTCRWQRDVHEVTDPFWRPFLPGDSGFKTRQRQGSASGSYHQERLRTLVNYAARPMPAAQWFERTEDGAGIGQGGLHLDADMPGRRLPVEAFPELLVDEQWSDPADAQLVRDFHDWHAALLLAHPNLSRQTRVRLEQAACRRPEPLLDSYPMLPSIIDRDAMTVAVVQARLIRSA